MKPQHTKVIELTRHSAASCSLAARHPSEQLHVTGVTGTNGKTTVAYLIGEVLKAAGHKPFVLGTFNSGNSDLSTPEAPDIQNFMQDHLDQGGTHFVMEVTSEGIDQGRVEGIDFDIKILTNITRDHLDYHKTFAAYQSVKLGFMGEGIAHKIYSRNFDSEIVEFTTQLLGDFNLLNVKAAAAALRHIGISETCIAQTLATCAAPAGRLESVVRGQAFLVLVDYAHTPDGLKSVLTTMKTLARARSGNLLVLFGCGGDRDRGKRPEMGRIASGIADFVVLTDDNPRTECSQDIMSEILSGFDTNFKDFVQIQDRRRAIEFIINRCQSEDVVLLAGKGHETYQIANAGPIHFDDREEAGAIIQNRINEGIDSQCTI